MEGLATGRLSGPVDTAPGGLALVQELLNTATRPGAEASHVADLLSDADTANRWLATASAQWVEATGQSDPGLQLGDADLAPLRRFREAVRAAAVGPASEAVSAGGPDGPEPGSAARRSAPSPAASPIPTTAAATVALRFTEDGSVAYGTSASGWRGLAALVTTEALLAQRSGTWERFKTCPFPECGIAFFDRTRNNNRVWHDVRTCGNRTNLRASRQKRRGAESGAAQELSR